MEGKNISKMGNEGYQFYMDPFNFAGFPNGERIKDVCERTQAFLKELISRDGGKVYLISTHGCAMRAMVNYLKDDPSDYWYGHAPYNCSFTIVETENGTPRITAVDEVYYDKNMIVDHFKHFFKQGLGRNSKNGVDKYMNQNSFLKIRTKNECSDTRNYGIDLLRIISMVMIVILHVIYHGNVIDSANKGSNQYYLISFIQIMVCCAVNCYGLISGYVGYGKKFKLANLLNLWIEVLFFSVSIYFAFKLFYPNLSFRGLFSSFFPLILDAYWYFSAYFLMFVFTPFFNFLIKKLSKKQATILVITIILFSSVLPLFFKSDRISLEGGYCALWLSFLYIIGAYIKKYDIFRKIQKYNFFIVYLLCVIVSFGYKVFFEITTLNIPSPFTYLSDSNLLVSYTSPTILFCGISLLLLFSKLSIDRCITKPITILSSATFGVYLIHDNPLCEEYIMPKLAFIADLSVLVIPFAIIGVALSIWLIASIIEIGRKELFQLVRIKKLLLFLDKKIIDLINKLINRIISN